MTIYDDPNREAVGMAPIWTGAGEPPPEGDVESMTKAELLDYAASRDIHVEDGWTKAEIRDAIG